MPKAKTLWGDTSKLENVFSDDFIMAQSIKFSLNFDKLKDTLLILEDDHLTDYLIDGSLDRQGKIIRNQNFEMFTSYIKKSKERWQKASSNLKCNG